MGIRYTAAGESHGPMLVGIIEDIPYGLDITESDIQRELDRRRLGYGRSSRMDIERDGVRIVSGVVRGKSIGSPIALIIENADRRRDLQPLTAARAGHADYAGAKKLGITDARAVAERASARSTAMTVALGAIAKRYLSELGIFVGSHTLDIGGVRAMPVSDISDLNARADGNAVRCLDGAASRAMTEKIDAAKAAGDTLGGVTEVIVIGCAAGIGSYAYPDGRLDGRIMRAVGCIPSVKAVEIGDVINGARTGSAFHDGFTAERGALTRTGNNAGGMEGGMTNGMPVVVRAYIKPIPTLARGIFALDLKSFAPCEGVSERADVCAVPSIGVIAEAAVALELAAAISEETGGSTMSAVKARYAAFKL